KPQLLHFQPLVVHHYRHAGLLPIRKVPESYRPSAARDLMTSDKILLPRRGSAKWRFYDRPGTTRPTHYRPPPVPRRCDVRGGLRAWAAAEHRRGAGV